MVDALENYKEIHGDLLVKKRYAYHVGNILHDSQVAKLKMPLNFVI